MEIPTATALCSPMVITTATVSSAGRNSTMDIASSVVSRNLRQTRSTMVTSHVKDQGSEISD